LAGRHFISIPSYAGIMLVARLDRLTTRPASRPTSRLTTRLATRVAKFEFHQGDRIAQAGQRLPHVDRAVAIDATALSFNPGPCPVKQRPPLGESEPTARRNRQSVEIVADELLGGRMHAQMIHPQRSVA
jgi:hypothetical protein